MVGIMQWLEIVRESLARTVVGKLVTEEGAGGKAKSFTGASGMRGDCVGERRSNSEDPSWYSRDCSLCCHPGTCNSRYLFSSKPMFSGSMCCIGPRTVSGPD